MNHTKKNVMGLLSAGLLGFSSVSSATVINKVVMKVSDNPMKTGTVIDPHLDWLNAGGVNEGVAGAAVLVNNGIDYKDSWVDSNWSEILSVRVSMYSQGSEVAHIDFNGAGTTKSDFFQLANVTGSSWTGVGGGNFFSIAGDPGNQRHWFVQNNYGGCSVDRGWMVVLEARSGPCTWDNTGRLALGDTTRGFLYSTLTSHGNWNISSEYGVADVFAVSVSYDDGTVPPTPAPVASTALLLSGGLAGFAALRRRRIRNI